MKQSYTILYVDDDQDDLLLITEAFAKYTEKLTVINACNGHDGIQTLEKMNRNGSLPCLIIMDINMPVLNGLDALVQIRSQAEFKDIPIVLFSTSSNHKDAEFAAQWGAGYLTKPTSYGDLQDLVKEFVSWCSVKFEEIH